MRVGLMKDKYFGYLSQEASKSYNVSVAALVKSASASSNWWVATLQRATRARMLLLVVHLRQTLYFSVDPPTTHVNAHTINWLRRALPRSPVKG